MPTRVPVPHSPSTPPCSANPCAAPLHPLHGPSCIAHARESPASPESPALPSLPALPALLASPAQSDRYLSERRGKAREKLRGRLCLQGARGKPPRSPIILSLLALPEMQSVHTAQQCPAQHHASPRPRIRPRKAPCRFQPEEAGGGLLPCRQKSTRSLEGASARGMRWAPLESRQARVEGWVGSRESGIERPGGRQESHT